jgi:hypothetical protein
MHCSIGSGNPDPNRHFQRKPWEYAFLVHGQDS